VDIHIVSDIFVFNDHSRYSIIEPKYKTAMQTMKVSYPTMVTTTTVTKTTKKKAKGKGSAKGGNQIVINFPGGSDVTAFLQGLANLAGGND
jgi:hypothetical protein